jgi:hypothetical protein
MSWIPPVGLATSQKPGCVSALSRHRAATSLHLTTMQTIIDPDKHRMHLQRGVTAQAISHPFVCFEYYAQVRQFSRFFLGRLVHFYT